MRFNVFSDFHHSGLLNSLIMLFEGRLEGCLMRPIGHEWHNRGFWKIADHPATVEQYLGIGGATPDKSPKLNEVRAWYGTGIGRSLPGDGPIGRATDATIYECRDISSGETNKGITLDGFMHLPIDFVIASVPQHIRTFRQICNQHAKKPKLIYQIGNHWNIEPALEELIDGIMASARLGREPIVPYIEYHQEFSLDIFKPDFSYPQKRISSFVNCFDSAHIFKFDWRLFEAVEKSLPDWKFRAYGGSCRDGYAKGDKGVADGMRKSRFVWHTKNGGDGYGHVIHNIGAVGRPMIVRKSYYIGKMAEPLLIDGKTCICIDGLSEKEIVEKILYFSQESRYKKMCKNAYQNFKKVVDFDQEAEALQKFFEKLV